MNSLLLLRRVQPPHAAAAWACRRCYTAAPAAGPIGTTGAATNTTRTTAVKTPARTRFAPSPTGFLHLGSLRTALFNYLLAKNTGGQFVLRIEDTDQKRTVPGAEQSIFETLRWAGLQWDEGPEAGGPYGPYRQSERSDLHRAHAHTLLAAGHAYRCFCGPARLHALASKRQSNGLPVEYDRRCFHLPAGESASRAAAGEAHVLRLKTPDQYPSFTDAVYGPITYGENTAAHAQGSFEDPILLKSDGMPTYHLANVIDDHLMRITHVLRASEWMPSTPKHVHLYNCFGWTPPTWVHVGLLQDKSYAKLSKRTGSVMVSEYRERGYTAETMRNFVALLGWSHGGEGRSDVMTLPELVEMFNIGGLTKGNTVVNFEKLDYLQKSHVRRRLLNDPEAQAAEVDQIEKLAREIYGDKLEDGTPITRAYLHRLLHLQLNNYLTASSFLTQTPYFFTAPTFTHPPALKVIRNLAKFFRQSGCSVAELYHGFIEQFDAIPDTPEAYTVERMKEVIDWEKDLDEEVWQFRMRLLRLALTGGMPGPGLADTMVALGKERCLARFRGVDGALETVVAVGDGELVAGEGAVGGGSEGRAQVEEKVLERAARAERLEKEERDKMERRGEKEERAERKWKGKIEHKIEKRMPSWGGRGKRGKS